MAEVANIAEGKESEVMTASIPTVYAEVVKLEKIDKDRAKTIEDAFAADPSYGANRRGKYDVDKAIGTAKTFDEADKAVKAITYDPLSQLTALATAGTYEKEYADPKDANQTITYVFSKNTNNNGYIFTPKVK